jgi:hypothetical protein
MMKRQLANFAIASLLIWACAGSKREDDGTRVPRDKEKLLETLTLFVEAVQGDRFEKAFQYLTPAERAKMTDSTSQAPSVIRRQLKALRLSTLAQKPGVRLDNDKLEGIYEWLPQIVAPATEVMPDSGGPLIQ